MARKHRQHVGRWGEDAAARYLQEKGYQILARNMRTRQGEIDIIARAQDGCLVFVEVKTRTNQAMGNPEEGVDARKVEHLVLAAQAYLEANPDLAAGEWQFDVVAIQGRPGEGEEVVRIEHFENIAA